MSRRCLFRGWHRGRVAAGGAGTTRRAIAFAVALLAAVARRPLLLVLFRRFTLVRPLMAALLLPTAAPLARAALCQVAVPAGCPGRPRWPRLCFPAVFVAVGASLAQNLDACEQRHLPTTQLQVRLGAWPFLTPAAPPPTFTDRGWNEGHGIMLPAPFEPALDTLWAGVSREAAAHTSKPDQQSESLRQPMRQPMRQLKR